MTLQHLINRYLDGEVTAAEDIQLRTMVRQDPSAREAFDAAVLLHLGLLSEQHDSAPEEYRQQLFLTIEHICTTQPAGDKATELAIRRTQRGFKQTLTLTVLLLITVFPFSDAFMDWPSIAHPLKRVAAVKSDLAVTVPVARHHRFELGAAQDMQTSGSDCTISSDTSSIEATDYVPESTGNVVFSDLSFAALPSTEQHAENNGKPNITDETINTDIAIAEDLRDQQAIPMFFSTTFSTGFRSSLPATDAIRHYNASLAYGLSNDDKVGLEIGTTSYSVEQGVRTLEQAGGGGAVMASATVNPEVSNGKLSSPNFGTHRYVRDSTTIAIQQTTFWGGVFYERKVLRLNDVSIAGRVGAGVGQQGLVGYGRITGEWKVVGPLTFILGAELRGMEFVSGQANSIGSPLTFGMVASALTGLHVRF